VRRILVALLALCLAASAFPKGGQTKQQAAIGGVTIGSQGSGLYSGYTLAGGDAFDGLLSVMHMDDPYARYNPTHTYYAGARSVTGALIDGYDTDPYHTGSQDSNRGVSVGTNDTLVQDATGLTARTRTANAQELPKINGRLLVRGMVGSGPWLTFSPPVIVEWYAKFTGTSNNSPFRWHPSIWIQSASPLDSCDNCPSPGGQEYDWPEGDPNYERGNYLTHGTTIGLPGHTFNFTTAMMGSGYHLFTLVMTSSGVTAYLDGVQSWTYAQDATNSLRPFEFYITNHTYSNNTAAPVDLTTWNALGTNGAIINCAWWRVWVPTRTGPLSETPLIKLPTIKVNWNQSFSYTFPTPTALWGSAISDYPQAIRFEDFEPGATGEGTTGYQRFPAELTYNVATRTLSGTVNTRPGRLHLMSVPFVPGTVGYSARGYIDVGPRITVSSITAATHGTSYSYDLYTVCDVGTLLPKTITISGLPAGLSFDPSTGLISGTPTNAGSSTLTVGVTNAVGQQATKSVSLTVN
jgi:hypothetical protein